jgi:hypothetical protein
MGLDGNHRNERETGGGRAYPNEQRIPQRSAALLDGLRFVCPWDPQSVSVKLKNDYDSLTS